MTNEEIIARVVAMDAAGLDLAELTDLLINEFRHQEVSYRNARMEVTHKSRAELVVSLLFKRFRMPEPPAPADPFRLQTMDEAAEGIRAFARNEEPPHR